MAEDSRPDTWAHIHRVRELMTQVVHDLLDRAQEHDQTKLREPELSVFDEYGPKLAELKYGSPEYKAALDGMRPALEHHYHTYRHHPEYFGGGFGDMNLIDLIEMLIDWKAAGERHEDGGDVLRSIEVNAKRFGYGPEMKRLLKNTAIDLHLT